MTSAVAVLEELTSISKLLASVIKDDEYEYGILIKE